MKLYAVEITYSAYVLAENRSEAEEFVYEICGNETPSTDVMTELPNPKFPYLSWDDDALVYHNKPCDITLKEARAMIKKS